MHVFNERIRKHAKHVKSVGAYCNTEETTKQALILPMLDILGFSPFDPTKVKAEYGVDLPGVKGSERIDYALFCHGMPVMLIAVKAYSETLENHCPQLARYFNATPKMTIAAITNGREWRFFTGLNNKNAMDATPFLSVSFENMDGTLVNRLSRFRHDEFQPEVLRMLAEETVYLNAFTDVISQALCKPDPEFVRYVAGRAGIQRQINARFIESATPIVKQAVERSVSKMAVSGLSTKPINSKPVETADEQQDIIDPDNPKIVTTYAERRIFEVAKNIVGDADIIARDTENYFSVLYQNKANRWLLRYYGNRRQPAITVCVPMTEERKHEIIRAGLQIGIGDSILLPHPEYLLCIPGIIFDALEYCKDDANFKRAQTVE